VSDVREHSLTTNDTFKSSCPMRVIFGTNSMLLNEYMLPARRRFNFALHLLSVRILPWEILRNLKSPTQLKKSIFWRT